MRPKSLFILPKGAVPRLRPPGARRAVREWTVASVQDERLCPRVACARRLGRLCIVSPENELVRCLRDAPSASIEAELARSEARGYYESLLDQAEADSDGTDPDILPEETPPPGWSTFADSGAVELDPGYLRWRLKPNLDLAWNATRIRTNHLGARSPEIAIPKPANTFRIVVLGSSNTMGHGVDDEDIYVRRLERWLDSLKWTGGLRVEVVNLAVSSDAPSQRLLRLQQDVAPLQPDWILCDATVIDISLEELHLEATIKKQTPIPFAYVRQAIQKAGVSASDDSETVMTKLRSVYEPLLDGAWAGWAAESRRLDVPLTVVLLPRADAKGRAPRVEALIHSLADRHHLDLIDLSGGLRRPVRRPVPRLALGPAPERPRPSCFVRGPPVGTGVSGQASWPVLARFALLTRADTGTTAAECSRETAAPDRARPSGSIGRGINPVSNDSDGSFSMSVFKAAVTQRVSSSSVLGISTIRASSRRSRQQVSRQAEITARSSGNEIGTRARVRKLLVRLLTRIGTGSMACARRSVVRSARPIPRAFPRLSGAGRGPRA